ncbi:ras-like GTP-binding protein rhoA [Trichonephila inaurata madagascariensis]|uniref:Ras-like GTP-binding protein rhoA n=1 Tax=Trichonephila inaurata madagascariensis TaxID=2747483 RepID=A0A8X6YXP5_9ARAC|nr:ras-like GTP-binding protein rhoA [Trichonephila inaurata madagascariensis]
MAEASVPSTSSLSDIPRTQCGETEKYDWTETIQTHLKIAVVGDQGCGKTCFILSAKNHILPDPEEKVLSKQYPLDLEMPNKVVAKCMVVEADARDELREVRMEHYEQSDVFLLCFALDDPNSFKNITEKWVPELKECLSKRLGLLVGLKLDAKREILAERGDNLKEELKFQEYRECSAYKGINVLHVFQKAAEMAFKSELLEKK